MIAISILIEAGAFLSGGLFFVTGKQNVAAAQALAYAVSAVVVSIGVSNFLGKRGVTSQQTWCWNAAADSCSAPWWKGGANRRSLLLAIAGGALLSGFAIAYLALLHHLPVTKEMMQSAEEQMARIPHLRLYYGVIAIAFAPFAEEYLFRGLLYKALDREWHGWPAVLGSAAFFAIYHPVTSWLPVALLGGMNALLFRRTGRLAPCVAAHMVYNAILILH